MNKDTLVNLVKFKRWMDGETLKTIKAIDDAAYPQKRHLMMRLMNHIYVVDMVSGPISPVSSMVTPR